MAAVLLHQFYLAQWVVILRMISLDATAALTVASGLHYAWLVTRRMPAPAAENSPGGGKQGV